MNSETLDAALVEALNGIYGSIDDKLIISNVSIIFKIFYNLKIIILFEKFNKYKLY